MKTEALQKYSGKLYLTSLNHTEVLPRPRRDYWHFTAARMEEYRKKKEKRLHGLRVYQLAACLAYLCTRPTLISQYAVKTTFLRTREQTTKQDSPQCVTNTVISYFLSCPQKQELRHHTTVQEWQDMPGMPALRKQQLQSNFKVSLGCERWWGEISKMEPYYYCVDNDYLIRNTTDSSHM